MKHTDRINFQAFSFKEPDRGCEQTPNDLFAPESSDHIKREREKARILKKTRWWREKLKKGLCRHCGKNFPPGELTMDHLVPLVRGGRTGKNNVDTACKKCNSQKSFKSLLELKQN